MNLFPCASILGKALLFGVTLDRNYTSIYSRYLFLFKLPFTLVESKTLHAIVNNFPVYTEGKYLKKKKKKCLIPVKGDL